MSSRYTGECPPDFRQLASVRGGGCIDESHISELPATRLKLESLTIYRRTEVCKNLKQSTWNIIAVSVFSYGLKMKVFI